MNKLLILLLFTSFNTYSQSITDIYHQLNNQTLDKRNEVKDGKSIYPAQQMYYEGNGYNLVPYTSANNQVNNVFEPMKDRLPDHIVEANTPIKTTISGKNTVPQFFVDKNEWQANREYIASKTPMFVPGSIQKEWDSMWSSLSHGEKRDMWGGTLTRYSNQVMYSSLNVCSRGCTFSMLDNPMSVAYNIPSIRRYWETSLGVPLNGDMRGYSTDENVVTSKPIKSFSVIDELLK